MGILLDEINKSKYEPVIRYNIRQKFANIINEEFGTRIKYICLDDFVTNTIDYSDTLRKRMLDNFLKSSYN